MSPVSNDGRKHIGIHCALIGGVYESTPDAACAPIVEHYLNAVAEDWGQCQVLTEKMPNNFRFVPFVAHALPQSKTIYVVGAPMVVAWSKFNKFSSGAGVGFSYDLNDCLNYHDAHLEYMSDCMDRYPDTIHRVCCKDLVSQSETEIPKIIDRIIFKWFGEYLNSTPSDYIPRTASQWQVQEHIYRGSSNAWQAYEDLLVAHLKQGG